MISADNFSPEFSRNMQNKHNIHCNIIQHAHAKAGEEFYSNNVEVGSLHYHLFVNVLETKVVIATPQLSLEIVFCLPSRTFNKLSQM